MIKEIEELIKKKSRNGEERQPAEKEFNEAERKIVKKKLGFLNEMHKRIPTKNVVSFENFQKLWNCVH
jgi:hypothetical protein